MVFVRVGVVDGSVEQTAEWRTGCREHTLAGAPLARAHAGESTTGGKHTLPGAQLARAPLAGAHAGESTAGVKQTGSVGQLNGSGCCPSLEIFWYPF